MQVWKEANLFHCSECQLARLNEGISKSLVRQNHLKTWIAHLNAQYRPLLRLPRQAFAPSWSIWHYNWNKCGTLFFCTKAMKETSLSAVRFLIDLKRFHFHNSFTNLRTVGKCDFVRFNTQRLSKHEQLSKCLFAFHKKSILSKLIDFTNTCVML